MESRSWIEVSVNEYTSLLRAKDYQGAFNLALEAALYASTNYRKNSSTRALAARASFYSLAAMAISRTEFSDSLLEMYFMSKYSLAYLSANHSQREIEEPTRLSLDATEKRLSQLRGSVAALKVDPDAEPAQFMKSWTTKFGTLE